MYADQYALGETPAFQQRVQVAVATAAVNVMAETKSGLTDSVYAKRSALAKRVVTGLQAYVAVFSRLVVTNVAISVGSTDNDIQFTVNSMWSHVAGVDLDDLNGTVNA